MTLYKDVANSFLWRAYAGADELPEELRDGFLAEQLTTLRSERGTAAMRLMPNVAYYPRPTLARKIQATFGLLDPPATPMYRGSKKWAEATMQGEVELGDMLVEEGALRTPDAKYPQRKQHVPRHIWSPITAELVGLHMTKETMLARLVLPDLGALSSDAREHIVARVISPEVDEQSPVQHTRAI